LIDRPEGATHICNSSEGKLYCKYVEGHIHYYDKHVDKWVKLYNSYLKDTLRVIRGQEWVDEIKDIEFALCKIASEVSMLRAKLKRLYE
jgi:hypothetical protein